MARKPFVVIDAEILSSSIWSEAIHVRMIWFTMLVLCDTDGYVGASVPGIARAAGVTLEQTEDALRVLKAPDPHSRTKADEGRRVREVERGFLILHFRDHLDRLSRERAKSRDRMRRYRQRRRSDVTVTSTVTTGKREKGIGNREEDGRKEASPAIPPADRAERAIRLSTDALRTKLYALVSEAEVCDPKNRDPTELMRLFTSYQKQDGTGVRGVINASLLSHERLERSIKDAEEQIQEWRDGQGQRDPIQPAK